MDSRLSSNCRCVVNLALALPDSQASRAACNKQKLGVDIQLFKKASM